MAAVIDDLFLDLSLNQPQKDFVANNSSCASPGRCGNLAANTPTSLPAGRTRRLSLTATNWCAWRRVQWPNPAFPASRRIWWHRQLPSLCEERATFLRNSCFSLTQCYYYVRLLGLDGGLAQLAEERFHGAEFFVDTNLLLAFLFEQSRHHRSALELWELCKQQHISLHITEATLDELRRLIGHFRGIKEISTPFLTIWWRNAMCFSTQLPL